MKQLSEFTDIELVEALNRSYQTLMSAQQDIMTINQEVERRKNITTEEK